jgi:hypothetical protein
MRELADLIIASQSISFALYPIAALAVSIMYWRFRLSSLLLLAVGVWLCTIGFYAQSFPAWESYEQVSEKAAGFLESRWSDISLLLAAFGIVGEYVRLVALVWLSVDIVGGRMFKKSNKSLKPGTAQSAAP